MAVNMNGISEPTAQKVFSKGIYHGLPELSSAPKGMTAVVSGANGISGAHMVRALGENPERWSKVYALSRRPPSGVWPKTVQHVSVDFLDKPEQIAEVFREHKIRPDYIFFFSYVLVVDDNGALQWGDQRLVDQNNQLLTNFLEALPLASALPKRIFVQFGGKWYGVHLGATDIPDEESDPRVHLEPNLYYTQQDILESFCSKHHIAWNSALPSFVIGAAIDSSQSLMFPILAYACVQKYLGRKLEYPSDLSAWYAPQSLSNAMLDSYLYEWSVLAPNTENQAFNASDDCAFTWGKFWPRLAETFEMDYTGPLTSTEDCYKKGMKYEPPPHGKGGRSMMRYKFDFVQWAQNPENVAAWKEIAAKHQLRESEWKDVGSIFGRANFCLHRPYPSVLSATKAKKYGFFGFVDSYESIFSVIEEFAAMKIVPHPKDVIPKSK